MHIFNAFVEIPSLANNSAGQVAPFGELSINSNTFSRDVRNYNDTVNYPNVEIKSFSVLDDNSNTVDPAPSDLTNTALQLANFIYTQYLNNAIPMQTSVSTLIAGIGAEFPHVRNISIGQIMNTPTTGARLMDHIQYDYPIGTNEWRVTLWFNDHSFKVQYPLYEIVVVPPVGDISRLIDTPANVQEALESVDINYFISAVNAITTVNPQTDFYVYRLNWHDAAGSSTILPTQWACVVYGNAGNDQDAIKDAIRSYLANNSTGVDWTKIFPDLYAENEFLIIPFWGQLATPTSGTDDGLYSSGTPLGVINNVAMNMVPHSYQQSVNYTAFETNNVQVLGSCYRGLNLFSIGNPNNLNQMTSLLQMFPDYMAINTDKPDFARMSTRTQDFVITLLTVLEECRNFLPSTPADPNYTRSTKNGREYIGFPFESYTYYVMTRYGYNKSI